MSHATKPARLPDAAARPQPTRLTALIVPRPVPALAAEALAAEGAS